METSLYDVEGIAVEADAPMTALLKVLDLSRPPTPGDLWHNENLWDMPDLIVDYVTGGPTRAFIGLKSAGCLEIELSAHKVGVR